eukprot:12932214-Prorocentrum_lima.AAC.1
MRTGSWVSRTQKKHKGKVLQFLKVFAAAGWRLDLTNNGELDVKYSIFMNDPSGRNQDEHTKAEG